MTVQEAVEAAFPGVKITGTGVPGRTGCMEVYVVRDGKKTRVHSKLGGDGPVGSKNIEGIIGKIKGVVC